MNEAEREKMITLLTNFILQKFRHLTRKEINDMIELVPLEETVAGKELVVMGEIKFLAFLIKQKFEDAPSNLPEILGQLQNSELLALGAFLLKATSYENVAGWIEGRLNKEISNL